MWLKYRSLLVAAVAFVCILAVNLAYTQPMPSVTLHGVTFQVAVCQGEQKTSPEFHQGEIACIRAIPPVGGTTVDVQVDLIHPTAGRITPMSRRTLTLSADTTLTEASYAIQPGDPEGDYVFRISVWRAGELREGTLTFRVVKPSPEVPWWIVALIVAVAAFGGYMYLTRRREARAQLAAPTPAVAAAPGEATQVYAQPPATIPIRTPTGETLTLAAYFAAGTKMIPITTLPQTFGREDFRGLADESTLRVISRRHFTVDYDYRQGTFLIQDAGSTNGTLLNGEEIRGKGPVPLKDGDIVSPAGVLQLRFSTKAA
jgi:hypothetical protein